MMFFPRLAFHNELAEEMASKMKEDKQQLTNQPTNQLTSHAHDVEPANLDHDVFMVT